MAYQPHIEDAQEVLTDDEIIALMPKNMRFIAELIGIRDTLAIIKAFSGSLLFIPKKHALNIHHDITGVIGLSKLQILAEHMGGQTIEIPMGTLVTRYMRNRLIQIAVNEKRESKAKLARKFGVTTRWIREAAKKEIKPLESDQNLDLFK